MTKRGAVSRPTFGLLRLHRAPPPRRRIHRQLTYVIPFLTTSIVRGIRKQDAFQYSRTFFLHTIQSPTLTFLKMSLSLDSAVKLTSGRYLPRLGLGVYLARGKEGEESVKHALQTGYRQSELSTVAILVTDRRSRPVDSAQYYHNEAGKLIDRWRLRLLHRHTFCLHREAEQYLP